MWVTFQKCARYHLSMSYNTSAHAINLGTCLHVMFDIQSHHMQGTHRDVRAIHKLLLLLYMCPGVRSIMLRHLVHAGPVVSAGAVAPVANPRAHA